MKTAYRAFALALALCAGFVAGASVAQSFPVRPIRVIVPYAPAGGSDITIRIVQPKVSEVLGQPLVIENRPGAATLIGTRAVQNATADGYTVGVMDPAFIINPTLFNNARYDALKDFTPVTLITATPLTLVVPAASPAKTLQGLVDQVKANAGKLTYGSPGEGSAGHLAIEQFRSFFGLQMVHVPYKGAGPAVTAVVGSEIPMLMAGSGSVPFIQEGRLRGLAVTSAKRLTTVPNVPTFAELGFPQINVQTFAGVVAPAGIPSPALQRLHDAFATATRTADVRAKLEQFSQVPVGNTPREFGTFLEDNRVQLVKVVREANIKVE
jgi:tripartite-type tricarboxylate transporter receptor subunit TctC